MGGVAGTIPVLAQRAASEGPRWTRAVGIIPATPKKWRCAAALPGIRRVLACQSWAGEKDEPFEHPTGTCSCCATCADYQSSHVLK